MTSNQQIWRQAKNDLAAALASLGYPESLADLLARQLGSPKAMERMTAYLYQAQPRTLETIVDEMLAICADMESWRVRKESREAQAGYSAWLNSETRSGNMDEE